MKKILIVAVFVLLTVTAYTQVPITKSLVWDASLNTDDYLVTLDGSTIGITTALTVPFTITTVGSHTFTVTSRNAWYPTGAPLGASTATFVVNVTSPGKSGNLRIQ